MGNCRPGSTVLHPLLNGWTEQEVMQEPRIHLPLVGPKKYGALSEAESLIPVDSRYIAHRGLSGKNQVLCSRPTSLSP